MPPARPPDPVPIVFPRDDAPHDRLTEVQEHFADQPSIQLDLLRCTSSGLSRDRGLTGHNEQYGEYRDGSHKNQRDR